MSQNITPTISNYGYTMNNKYPNFPPLMNDSRNLIASYQPITIIENKYVKEANTTSNMEYRKYLMDNAKSIMLHNIQQACNDVGYYHPFDEHTKYLAMSETNSQFKPSIANGLQTNYSYVASNNSNVSDLRNKYVSDLQKTMKGNFNRQF